MKHALGSSFARRLTAALNGKNAFEVGEALGITAEAILEMASALVRDKDLSEEERGRRSILLLELHSGVRNAAVSLNAKATAPPHMQAPRKLHDAHLA